MTYTSAECTEKTPDDGQRNCPKHVEFLEEINLGKLVRLVGFIVKKFVTMHGHMYVKINWTCVDVTFSAHWFLMLLGFRV